LNDWSARDIQFAEMTPLGPFNGKGSATTISPWVVTLDALEGAEAGTRDEEALERIAGRTCHLKHEGKEYTWDIGVDVGLRRREKEILKVGESNLRDLYWSPMQMLSHHASSGCGLRTGDLLGTGTISSPATRNEEGVSSWGCLHEMTSGGTKAFVLQNGEKITWIEDGDEVVMTGKAVRLDGSVIGFGECSNVLESALAE
jgi:fumarylacetoacetase